MQKVLIIDFGSQYTQLIARKVREQNVYCEIWPCTVVFSKIRRFEPRAIILSGGPASVLAQGSPTIDPKVLELNVPILGICYGMQLITKMLGGKVVSAKQREYGPAKIVLCHSESARGRTKNLPATRRSFSAKGRIRMTDSSVHPLFRGVAKTTQVWMSHGDSIAQLAPRTSLLASSDKGVPAAIANNEKRIYALQFHPEVHHTREGKQILKNFLFGICKLKKNWNMRNFIDFECQRIRETVGRDHVILGLSGGVDSSVAAALIHKAIGKQLTCIFVNNGLLRLNEERRVQEVFKRSMGGMGKMVYVDAGEEFLTALDGISDPEQKRKIIGKVFVDVFVREAKKIKNAKFLAQGTLYPDVIESTSFKGPSAVIKSHHNVGGLPKKLGLKILEPLRELFKDEVRELGRELGLPDHIIMRHPFPGPGLGVRVLGSVTKEKVELLQKADHIAIEEIKKANWYKKIWQAFVVLLPVRSVGVMGDERTYENVVALRAVDSVDGMTADWIDLPHELLSKISNRIINEVRGINRVVYDISSKPPATIEWE